jgi:hypothetical protein
MIYKGIARGKTIELEEPLPYPEGQPVSVSVELLSSRGPAGSPEAILQVVREAPHIRSEDVDAMEQAIEQGKLPVRASGIFDAGGAA